MKYNKISGFSDEIASDIKTQFTVLNKLNISYFEPRGVDGLNVSELNDEQRCLLKEQMAQYGIKASSIGSPIGKIKLTDDFETHFELFKNVVKTAKYLGTKYVRIFSFYHDGGDAWSDDERMEVLKRLQSMIRYAKAEGVVLLHENEKSIYGDTAERCVDLMDNLYCDNFKAVFDPANFVQCGQDTKDAYNRIKPYIEYMHIKDAYFSDGSVVPAGYGDGNLEYILTDLFKNGYTGFLSLEPHLGSFEGFAELENNNKAETLEKSDEGKFVLAYRSLVNILERSMV